MSFFGKIKQGLGIGTAKVELQIPGQIPKTSTEVSGKLIITAKSAQKVQSIKIRFVEEYSQGRDADKTTREYVLGTLELTEPFDLQQDERREIEFTLPFQLTLSSNQSLAEGSGVMGALGKVAVFAKNEKSEYKVKASVDLAGVALDPSDTQDIHLV
ncbi:MAG TPA: sporulation protein [Anaerolineaceae bacterium]|nr:sporulation protein [Anaerolineaceae bacterium]HQH85874.1 sporulation protein [Anaerolineaceae bacterium]